MNLVKTSILILAFTSLLFTSEAKIKFGIKDIKKAVDFIREGAPPKRTLKETVSLECS
jgi:hypothetical protein